MDHGVDAVIVDSVLAIRKGLTAAGTGSVTPGTAASRAKKVKKIVEEVFITPPVNVLPVS